MGKEHPDDAKLPETVRMLTRERRAENRAWLQDMIERRRMVVERTGVSLERTEFLRGELNVLYYLKERLGAVDGR